MALEFGLGHSDDPRKPILDRRLYRIMPSVSCVLGGMCEG